MSAHRPERLRLDHVRNRDMGAAARLWSKSHASAGNRTRVTSMATMYSTTRPLMHSASSALLKCQPLRSPGDMGRPNRAPCAPPSWWPVAEHRISRRQNYLSTHTHPPTHPAKPGMFVCTPCIFFPPCSRLPFVLPAFVCVFVYCFGFRWCALVFAARVSLFLSSCCRAPPVYPVICVCVCVCVVCNSVCLHTSLSMSCLCYAAFRSFCTEFPMCLVFWLPARVSSCSKVFHSCSPYLRCCSVRSGFPLVLSMCVCECLVRLSVLVHPDLFCVVVVLL